MQGANHESQLNYLFPAETDDRPLAPFGTDNTPQMRVRLVGGVPQMIVEDHRYKSVPVNQPVNQHIAINRAMQRVCVFK